MTNNTNLRNALIALGLATFAQVTGCTDATEGTGGSDDEGDSGEVVVGGDVGSPGGETAPEQVSCDPVIKGAAITKQISHLDDNGVDIEFVTLSLRPFQYAVSDVAAPQGMTIMSFASECQPSGDAKWLCLHRFTVSAGASCFASGAYTLTLNPIGDGSACGGVEGPAIQRTLTIATENLCPIVVDGGTEP